MRGGQCVNAAITLQQILILVGELDDALRDCGEKDVE
jgi:hypothetical protein